MKKIYERHRDKFWYLLVGGWNTLFGYAVFVILYYLFSRYIHYMLILVVSTVISITNAYIGYKFFVFRTKGNYLKEYLRFYLVYGFAFALNLVLLPIAVVVLHTSPLIAQAGIMVFTVVISYFGHKHFSFGKGFWPGQQS